MPGIYWLAVVLISVVGTLITDNLVDNFGVALRDDHDRLQRRPRRRSSRPGTGASAPSRSTPSSPPGARPSTGWRSSSPSPSAPRPATWSRRSSNSATCPRSGSSPGRSRSSPSPTSRFKLNAILAFWLAYILTRPLGASIGDYLSQPVEESGLGLGTIVTSVIFLATILALVVYLLGDEEGPRRRHARGGPPEASGRATRCPAAGGARLAERRQALGDALRLVRRAFATHIVVNARLLVGRVGERGALDDDRDLVAGLGSGGRPRGRRSRGAPGALRTMRAVASCP